MRLLWPIWLFLKTSFCASYKLLEHPIRFAALKILRHLDAHDTEHCLPEVAEADIFLEQVALMLDAKLVAADQHRRQVRVVVCVLGTAATAPDKHRVIEQCAVTFLNAPKLLDEVGPVFHVPRVDSGQPLKLVGLFAVVRHLVIAVGATFVGVAVSAVVEVAAGIVVDNARAIRLQRERDDIEHQSLVAAVIEITFGLQFGIECLNVLAEVDRSDFGLRFIEPCQIGGDILFDITNRIEVLVELRLVLFAEAALQAFGFVSHGIEHTAGPASARFACSDFFGKFGEKEFVEEDVRAVLGGDRSAPASPRQRLINRAAAKAGTSMNAKHEARKARRLADGFSEFLIGGDAELGVGVMSRGASQEGAVAAVPAGVRELQTADERELIPQMRHRLQNGRGFPFATKRCRRVVTAIYTEPPHGEDGSLGAF